jgi:tripeptidyl-peptidase-1
VADGSVSPPHVGYNPNGRGYPDISALALNYVVMIAGNLTAVSGTSASSPVMAGMISVLFLRIFVCLSS